MDDWVFKLNERVEIKESKETGLVIGRADYTYMERHYLVRYKAADGRAVEAWWGTSALKSADEAKQEA